MIPDLDEDKTPMAEPEDDLENNDLAFEPRSSRGNNGQISGREVMIGVGVRAGSENRGSGPVVIG